MILASGAWVDSDDDSHRPDKGLGLFEGYGVEVEYMVVNETSLDALPLARSVFAVAEERTPGPTVLADVTCSPGFSPYVVKLENAGPSATLSELPGRFSDGIREANRRLSTHQARLMPGGVHPWKVVESRETSGGAKQHQAAELDTPAVRRGGDRRVQGQGVRLSLPFRGDEEFARLHTAIRFLMPLIPSLSASSPFLEGRLAPFLDARLATYRTRGAQVLSSGGQLVPEAVGSEQEYRDTLWSPAGENLAQSASEGLHHHERVDSLGAVARFDRSAIEIRVIDGQECPSADAALLQLITRVLQGLVGESRAHYERQKRYPTEDLARMLLATTEAADRALIDDPEYLELLGVRQRPCRARDVWWELFATACPELPPKQHRALVLVLEQGPLARRMVRLIGRRPSRDELTELGQLMCWCLDEDRPLRTSVGPGI